jgi:hypothetical protein
MPADLRSPGFRQILTESIYDPSNCFAAQRHMMGDRDEQYLPFLAEKKAFLMPPKRVSYSAPPQLKTQSGASL